MSVSLTLIYLFYFSFQLFLGMYQMVSKNDFIKHKLFSREVTLCMGAMYASDMVNGRSPCPFLFVASICVFVCECEWMCVNVCECASDWNVSFMVVKLLGKRKEIVSQARWGKITYFFSSFRDLLMKFTQINCFSHSIKLSDLYGIDI